VPVGSAKLLLRSAKHGYDRLVHEVSVALGLLEQVETAARDEGADRVMAVVVKLGALSGIARDALLFSWDVVTAQTICEGSELRIEEVALVVECGRCGQGSPRPGSGLICPTCASIAPRIVRGRETEVVAVEVPA
jgi:hydrogenase nickel incorporation protein HypA/HybF